MSLYEADLHGEKVTDIYARLEVNERQEADPQHMPVILHLPHAMLLELRDSDDEAEVTLNLTFLEARTLAMHLTEAAQAAEGGAA
ncbi:hypothetical protein [Deinococcus sp. Leaf326]|uniref:hypothetical protein n=1 Tax=Deinococcus sp. Leaf326 TaxID=1736338 RepID=UPI0006F8AEEA|nr:hypothetical protein [Deinococcus sp. Leaf326]KQR33162.1 hypothetical protein ASF71_16865 [Deinococcus sp. Leaf326]